MPAQASADLFSSLDRELALLRSGSSRTLNCHDRGGLKMLRVVFHKLLHFSMSKSRVKVVVLHLGVDLVKIPMVVVETIDGTHYACPVSSSGTMYEELAG